MSLTTTLVLMALAFMVMLFAIFQSRRDYVPGRPPLVPYGFLLFASILFLLMLAGHVITHLTGQPYRGRF